MWMVEVVAAALLMSAPPRCRPASHGKAFVLSPAMSKVPPLLTVTVTPVKIWSPPLPLN